MDESERPVDALAAWFADPNATRSVHAVGPGYAGTLNRMGGSVVRSTPPPEGESDLSEITAVVTAYLPRWRMGGVTSHEGATCPLCVAGYAFGRAESTPTPDMAALCWACQRDIESLCALVAARLSRLYGRAVYVRDVLERFFSEVAPLGPLGRRYGHAYE